MDMVYVLLFMLMVDVSIFHFFHGLTWMFDALSFMVEGEGLRIEV